MDGVNSLVLLASNTHEYPLSHSIYGLITARIFSAGNFTAVDVGEVVQTHLKSPVVGLVCRPRISDMTLKVGC